MAAFAPDPGAPRPVILIVDDDVSITRMLDLMLTKLLGADVVVANGGFGVLNLIASRKPRVVLLDVMMPGLDGAAITGLIRGDRELARTRILLYSALDQDALARKVVECGADGFVPKTTRPTEIARRIERILGETE